MLGCVKGRQLRLQLLLLPKASPEQHLQKPHVYSGAGLCRRNDIWQPCTVLQSIDPKSAGCGTHKTSLIEALSLQFELSPCQLSSHTTLRPPSRSLTPATCSGCASSPASPDTTAVFSSIYLHLLAIEGHHAQQPNSIIRNAPALQ